MVVCVCVLYVSRVVFHLGMAVAQRATVRRAYFVRLTRSKQ